MISQSDVLATFLAESRALLQEMEDGRLRLEVDIDDNDAINSVFRAAHTIKGNAGCSASMTSWPSPMPARVCWTRCARATC